MLISVFKPSRLLIVPFVLTSIATPLRAQSMSGDTHPAASALEMLWSGMTGYITQVAEETPEGDYAWRPTEGVRSIGELIGHVAGAQYLMCAAAFGDPPREEDAVERSATTKAALVEALKASTEYCARAYRQSDEALRGETELFGQKGTWYYALGMNATHNGEHYGNL
ncbi:MAG: DinB family protein, partial [Gemmatimonadales bacterium]